MMQGVDNNRGLPGKAYDQIVIAVNYLGRKVTQLPQIAADLCRNHLIEVIFTIVAIVALICFWEIGVVLSGMIAGFEVGEYVSPWIAISVQQWCVEFLQEHSALLGVVVVVVISLATQYLIASAVINTVISIIKGVGGERQGQGGYGGVNNINEDEVLENY